MGIIRLAGMRFGMHSATQMVPDTGFHSRGPSELPIARNSLSIRRPPFPCC